MSTESRDEAIREAKRYVRDVVRNDWSFEFSTKPGAPPPTYPLSPEPKEVLEWRLREYDSSGSEFEPQLSPTVSPDRYDPHGALTGALTSSSFSSSSAARRTERRRKRRRQMEEEMSWNEGLRTWVERRDAWSGAKFKEQIQIQRGDETGQTSPSTVSSELQGPGSSAEIQSLPASAASSTIPPSATGESSNLVSRIEAAMNINEKGVNGVDDRRDRDAEGHSTTNDDSKQKASTETAITEPDATPKTLSSTALPATALTSTDVTPTPTTSSSTENFEDPVIPVVPSLIATSNPIRASITPTMYPSIYSKVVIQGLTPTVPINLADMTKAMVQGWKADGQWPPKPTSIVLPDDSLVRTKHPDTPAIPPSADKTPSSPESRKKSGIASTVRKVLHFSGFHPHPFHRRGSSSQQHVHPDDIAAAGESPSGHLNPERAEK